MHNIKKAAIVLNGFIHDLATGYWLSNMIVILLLHNFHSEYPALLDPLNTIERFFLWNSLMAVLVIFATGGIRSFTYVDNFFGEDVERARRKLLFAKHIVLLVIFGVGSYIGYIMAYH